MGGGKGRTEKGNNLQSDSNNTSNNNSMPISSVISQNIYLQY